MKPRYHKFFIADNADQIISTPFEIERKQEAFINSTLKLNKKRFFYPISHIFFMGQNIADSSMF